MLTMLITLVFLTRPTDAFLFQNSKGDCSGRSAFMYNALYKDSSLIDVAFFGSSKTMNDINDSMMMSNTGKKFLNFGYCRFGRNLDYFFIKQFFKKHHATKIVLEVREEEGNNLHPMTAFLMPLSEISKGFYFFNPEVFSNLYNKWLCNLKYLRGELFSYSLQEPGAMKINHGFWYGNKTTDILPLIEKRKTDSVSYIVDHPQSPNQLNYNSRYYLNLIKSICDENKAELVFLYLPSYGNIYGKPLMLTQYNFYGKVLLPPDSTAKNVLNYSDFGHLNKKGADELSLWLIKALNE